ncbi:4-hydroxy-3-methylbut-2-enyl diphosphate reductase [bacterium]|nr:4-hydroxy-3-methylbut-2-enyl diphosphate reductase [bacterium]
MEIIIAKNAGFCFGVRRAINLVEKAMAGKKSLYTLGPIIHNPQVVSKLEKQGVSIICDLSKLEKGRVVVRSHGADLSFFKEAKEKGVEVVDATCPFVKNAQNLIKRLSKEKYKIIIVGEENHPEVKGLLSYANTQVKIVQRIDQLKDVFSWRRIGVISQTTQLRENFKVIIVALLQQAKEIKIYNTICEATQNRQKEAKKIAKKVDSMLIIGGYNSANTNRLVKICKEIQEKTYHIETEKDLVKSWFENVKKIGISTGTSTPQWIIEKVVKKLRRLKL